MEYTNIKPITLIIMDGYGLRDDTRGNAIAAARKPNLDRLLDTCPNTVLGCAGLDVGLPEGQMGTSEVGHANIGAGRILFQSLPRISKAIDDGSFFSNPALTAAVEHAKKNNSALHLVGLVSDGGVHTHINHIYALLELARRNGLTDVYIHACLDGRDVAQTSGAGFVQDLLDKMSELGVGKIATVTGRYYAMDRDNRWDRVERAYEAFVYGHAAHNTDPIAAIKASYDAGLTDEFMLPVVTTADPAEGRIAAKDSVVFFNFRPDRAREITRTFVDPDFSGFVRKTGCLKPFYVCMCEYDASMPNVHVAFEPVRQNMIFGEYIASMGLKQLRIAETEKYAHVTFFFNGGRETVYDGEERILIPSPQIATYDQQPEMSAYQVADRLVDEIRLRKYDVIICNFANCDMVGHTAVYDAVVKSVEAVDECVGRVVAAMDEIGGITLITADHGNADLVYNEDDSPVPNHTTNPVPLILVGANNSLRSGVLADITPTMLALMGLAQPKEMTGQSLLV